MTKEICGIYKIENIKNGKLYIGQSKNIRKRLYEHKRTLNCGNHKNTYLQRSWNKYGEKSFSFIIIEECDKLELSEKEIIYIAMYKSNVSSFGYNLTNGGESGERSFEVGLKISNSLKGKKLSLEHRKTLSRIRYDKPNIKSKKVVQLDLSGNLIKIYDLMNQIYNYEGYNTWAIKNCCNHKNSNKTAYGYLWIYYDEYIKEEFDIARYNNTRKSIPVLQYTKDGVLVNQYESMSYASKETDIPIQNIQKCIVGERMSAGGFKWLKAS